VKKFRATSYKSAQINAPGYGGTQHERTERGATGWPISPQSHAILEYMQTHSPVTPGVVHLTVIAPRWPKWRPSQTTARMQSLVSSHRLIRTSAGMFARVPTVLCSICGCALDSKECAARHKSGVWPRGPDGTHLSKKQLAAASKTSKEPT
jgi:hypothetical protein